MNAISKIHAVTDYTIAAEIEAIARKLMEGDIEAGSDAMKLAADYTDVATEIYEDDCGIPIGSVPQNVIRMIRQSLTVRIKLEIDSRDWAFELEYAARQRSGRIDANGCGDVPTW